MVDNVRPGSAEETSQDQDADRASSQQGGQGGASATETAAGVAGAATAGVTDAPAQATEGVKDAAGQTTEGVKDAAGQTTEALKGATGGVTGDFRGVLREAQQAVAAEVRSAIMQATAELVVPAARKATTSAITYAATKGPEAVQGVVRSTVQNTVAPRLREAGGAKALAGAVLSKVPGAAVKIPQALSKLPGGGGVGAALRRAAGGRGGVGGGALTGVGRGRRLPMQAWVDVAVPLETAYDQWTQLEEFPKFMFRAERVEQRDDTHVVWQEKIWGVRRQWEAEIVEQVPNQRIVWRSVSGPQHVGVVTFHRLSDRLTRVQVNLDFQPTGLMEKTGSGSRAAIRALDTDLRRFKAFMEMKNEATGAWRGRVADGEVQPEQQADGGEQDQAQAEGEPQAQAEEADDEAEGEAAAQEDEEPQPQPEQQQAAAEDQAQAEQPAPEAPAARQSRARQDAGEDQSASGGQASQEPEPQPVVRRRAGDRRGSR
jgi:uncharacterized membrane protein